MTLGRRYFSDESAWSIRLAVGLALALTLFEAVCGATGLGASGLLVRPFSTGDLLRAIHSLLHKAA
jgi:hypothetical protein